MNIDIMSILVTGIGMTFVFLWLSAFTWAHGRGQVGGLRAWFIGYACFVAGMGLVALRGSIPDLFSVVMGNTLIIGGVMLKVIGNLEYLEQQITTIKSVLIGILVSSTALVWFFLDVQPSVQARMFVISMSLFLYACFAVYHLIRHSPAVLKKHTSIILVMYVIITLVFGFRTIRAFYWSPEQAWLGTQDSIESVMMLVIVIVLGGLAVGEMLLVHGRLERSLEATAEQLELTNHTLLDEIDRRTRAELELKAINNEMGSAQKEIMITLSEVVEFRSKETALHVARVSEYSRILAQAMGTDPQEVKLLADAAPMHDLGKIAIPDEILNKPGELTPEERALIRNHTTVGYQLLNKSERPLIKMAALIAHEHHEHWNGEGYPRGISGKAISFPGRIVCLCDIFDALAVARPYKAAWDLTHILEYIKQERGRIFDPEMVDAFFLNLDSFLHISTAMADPV